jgi:hypothetical protein
MSDHLQNHRSNYFELCNKLKSVTGDFIVLPLDHFIGRYRIVGHGTGYKSKSMNFVETKRFIDGLRCGLRLRKSK